MDEDTQESGVVAIRLDDDWAILDLGAVAGAMSFPFSAEWAMEVTSMFYAVEMLQSMTAKDIAEMQREFIAREKARGGSGGGPGDEKPYKVYDGVAHLNLVGTMVKRPTCMGSMFGEDTSTTKLRDMARRANRDDEVKSKLTRTDSPGGEVAGSFDLGDDLAGGKPLDVYYEDMGASAALIATMGARHATANQNAVLGSAGVYTALHDTSAMRERIGSRVHVVKAGKHKAIGHPGVSISDADLATVQARVDALHGLFLNKIAKGRPNMSAKQLADVGDASIYIGREAVKIGLIDGIGSFDEAHKQAVKSNQEGTRRVTVIKDKQLQAYLSGDPVAIAAANAEAASETLVAALTPAPAAAVAPPVGGTPVAAPAEGRTPPTGGSAITSTAAHPFAESLAALGIRSEADLRGLATDAMAGRAALAIARDKAIKLATAVYKDKEGIGASALASAEKFLGSAPLDVVQAAIDTYEADLANAGLAAQPGMRTVRRFTAPAAIPGAEATDATGVKPPTDMVAQYASSAYGAHDKNGKETK